MLEILSPSHSANPTSIAVEVPLRLSVVIEESALETRVCPESTPTTRTRFTHWLDHGALSAPERLDLKSIHFVDLLGVWIVQVVLVVVAVPTREELEAGGTLELAVTLVVLTPFSLFAIHISLQSD